MFFGVYMWPFGSHFWGRVPDISHKNKNAGERSVFHGDLQWSGRVGMRVVSGVIFGVEYLILATKTKMLGKQLFFGCMCGRFGALMGPPMVGDGRYANPRQKRQRLKPKNG